MAIAAVGVAASLTAGQPCRGGAGIVGPCAKIHGRLEATNGTPSVRIWVVGTKRILGVTPAEAEVMPEALRKHVRFGTRVFADFEVCPYTASEPGTMQDVCIQSGTNIVIEERGDRTSPARVRRLPGSFECPEK